MNQTTQPSPAQSKPITSQRRIWYIAGTILAVAILAAGIYLIYHNSQSSKTATPAAQYEKGPHNQNYSRLDNFKLDGPKPGTGISFEKPTDYTKALQSADNSQASFSHTLESPTFAPLGALHVLSSAAGFDTTGYISSLKKSLADPKSDAYKTTAEPIQTFLTSRFSPLYDVSFSDAKVLTTPNLSGNAWSLDFSATPKKFAQPAAGVNTSPDAKVDASQAKLVPSSVPPGFENYKGRVVLAVGKQAIYYFAVYNTNYNWDNNASVWQQVINSIKINQ